MRRFDNRVAHKRALMIVLADWDEALLNDEVGAGQACERLASRLWHKLRWMNPTYSAQDIQMVNLYYGQFRLQMYELERRQRFLEMNWILDQ